MKVLILITKSNWGGAQRYVYDLATNLHKKSYEVEVMAGGNGPLIDKLLQSNIKASSELPIGRDINLFEDIKAFFKLIKIIKERKPDVLHVNSSKIGGLGALAGRLNRVPKIVFTAHGWAFNENRTFISKLLIRISYWLILILSHSTIAVSETTKKQISTWPFSFEKISVVHNGISTEPLFSKINARYELAKIDSRLNDIFKSKNTTIIGSVGELHHIKGYDYAIKGIAEIVKHLESQKSDKKLLYIIIGGGEEKEKLQKLIKDLNVESSILLLGYVSQASQYLKAFDLFLLPSLSEGFPYIALEAGLASLPIVATAVGGIPEIIDDMNSGVLIQPQKPREIKHAIEFYLTHKKVQKEYGLAINTKIVSEFSIEKMVEKTIQVYLSNKSK